MTDARPSETSYARELAAFAAELSALRIAQGKPSLQEIEKHAPAGRPLSKSAVGEALAGKRLPSLDFLIALVQTLLMLGDPRRSQVSGRDVRLEDWRSRWRRLQLLQATGRRLQPATAEAPASGAIHRSMFSEALEADVYIADLTGANPNVYLELGVRWALSDGVTILICQDIAEIRFNAVANRVIEYGPMPDALENAVHRIAQAAVEGIKDPQRVDSPVREGSPTILVSRAEYEALGEEVSRLREQQAEELLVAAQGSADPRRKVTLLEEAVAPPAHFDTTMLTSSPSRTTSPRRRQTPSARLSTSARRWFRGPPDKPGPCVVTAVARPAPSVRPS